ncbi:MAG: hypothetical protein GX457_18400 [Thermotogaceae bacterium]|nr:hypothetical protein [Thermotogaceae bacterium]
MWFQERVFPTEREDNNRLTKNIVSGYCNYNSLHPESFKDTTSEPGGVCNALDLPDLQAFC